MDEHAKAAREIAESTGKGIDALRALGRFLTRYAGGSIEQAAGIVEDKLRYQRWERQVRLMERADAFLAGRGLDRPTRPVPLSLTIPLLQAGSLEESDDLQDRWAALLANAADAGSGVEVRRAFVSILEDLTPLDALVLSKIYELEVPTDPDFAQNIWTTHLPDWVTVERPQQENLRPPPDCEIAIQNLARLGLVQAAIAFGGMAIFSLVHRTMLGQEFMRACSSSR